MAMSAAQAGMSHMAQQQQSDAQYAYQVQEAKNQANYQTRLADANAAQIKANAEAANRAFIEEAAGTNQQLVEKEIAASQEVQAVQIENIQKTGTLIANSESMGLTTDLLLGDYHRQEAGYRDSTAHQLELDANQAQQNIKGFRSKAIDRGNSIKPYVPEPVAAAQRKGAPSLIGTALQIGGSAIGHYGNYATKQSDGTYTL